MRSRFMCLCVNLCRQLSYVKERCDREPEGEGVSALTTEERTRWAKVRVLTFGDLKWAMVHVCH